jgi:hypothetical protein
MCSFCYAPLQAPLRCGGCRKHPYCSKQCQRRDWKQHKNWCGRTAEIGVDFELRNAGGGKGLGYFALRDFAVGEKVLVERPVIRIAGCGIMRDARSLQSQFEVLPAATQAAILDLHTTQRTSAQKTMIANIVNCAVFEHFYSNAFHFDSFEGGEQSGGGMPIHGSRFNHACIPNCTRYYCSDQDMMVFSVSNSIKAGSEMTISYSDLTTFGMGLEQYQVYLMNGWGFHCSCPTCSDLSIFKKLETHAALFDQLMTLVQESMHVLGNIGDTAEFEFMAFQAIKVGKNAIRLSRELDIGSYQRQIYFEIFKMSSLMQRNPVSLKKAKQYGAKCLELLELELGGGTIVPDDLIQLKTFVGNPRMLAEGLMDGEN